MSEYTIKVLIEVLLMIILKDNLKKKKIMLIYVKIRCRNTRLLPEHYEIEYLFATVNVTTLTNKKKFATKKKTKTQEKKLRHTKEPHNRDFWNSSLNLSIGDNRR